MCLISIQDIKWTIGHYYFNIKYARVFFASAFICWVTKKLLPRKISSSCVKHTTLYVMTKWVMIGLVNSRIHTKCKGFRSSDIRKHSYLEVLWLISDTLQCPCCLEAAWIPTLWRGLLARLWVSPCWRAGSVLTWWWQGRLGNPWGSQRSAWPATGTSQLSCLNTTK